MGTHGVRLAIIVLVMAWLALGTLTAAGSLRRGPGRGLAVAAGLFFPVTWVIWYLADKNSGSASLRR